MRRSEIDPSQTPVNPERLYSKFKPYFDYLAPKLAGMYKGINDPDDVRQLLAEGLCRAVQTYDPSKSSPETHISRKAPHLAQDQLRASSSVTRRDMEHMKAIMEAQNSFYAMHLRLPTTNELSILLGMSERKLVAIKTRTLTPCPLELESRDDDEDGELDRNKALIDRDTTTQPESRFLAAERRMALEAALQVLGAREQEIIRLYFVESLTQREISRRLGLSESRVAQLNQSALFKLRKALHTNGADRSLLYE